MKHIINIFILLLLARGENYAQDSTYQSGRIYISRDRGTNWQRSDIGFPQNDAITAWAVNHKMILAGTDTHGVMISTDKAKSWYSSRKGLPLQVKITTLIISDRIIYAGTHLNGAFFSDDEGVSWHPCSNGMRNLTVRALYSVDKILYAGTNDGVYASSNEGHSWRKLDIAAKSVNRNSIASKTGYAPANEVNVMVDFQVNSFAGDERQLYVATSQGVIRSSDRGMTWEHIFRGAAISKIAVSKSQITLMDHKGVVYFSYFDKIVWLRDDLFFPTRSFFRLTPASPKLLRQPFDYWINTIYSPNNGLPGDVRFINLIDTPFGLLISAGSAGEGC